MRFTHHGPQYDTKLQASNFFPEKWSASKAPLLYTPGCSVSTSPCPAASRVALNPTTGASLGLGSALAIGTIVPNTGVITSGIIQAGQGIAKEKYVAKPLPVGPRRALPHDRTA